MGLTNILCDRTLFLVQIRHWYYDTYDYGHNYDRGRLVGKSKSHAAPNKARLKSLTKTLIPDYQLNYTIVRVS
jgi:hypothetical protein